MNSFVTKFEINVASEELFMDRASCIAVLTKNQCAITEQVALTQRALETSS